MTQELVSWTYVTQLAAALMGFAVQSIWVEKFLSVKCHAFANRDGQDPCATKISVNDRCSVEIVVAMAPVVWLGHRPLSAIVKTDTLAKIVV